MNNLSSVQAVIIQWKPVAILNKENSVKLTSVCTDPCKQTTLQSQNRRTKAYKLVQNISFQKLLVPLHLSSEDRK